MDSNAIPGANLRGFPYWFKLAFFDQEKPGHQAPKKQSIIGGTLSGFAAGLLGTGGAIRGLTMAAFNLEKNVFIATSAFIDFMIDFSRTFVYYRNGYIHEHDLKYVPFLLVIGIVGTYLGKKILNWIPQEKFKILSLILILAIGVFTLLKLGIQK